MSALDDLAASITFDLQAADIPGVVAVSRDTFVPNPDTPWDPSSGTTTTTDYDCQGWRDEYEQSEINGTLIAQGDVRVFILASTLAITPVTTDHVTVGGKVYSIISVATDPAGALWTLQCRA